MLGHRRRLNAPEDILGYLLSNLPVLRADRWWVGVKRCRMRLHQLANLFQRAFVGEWRPGKQVAHASNHTPTTQTPIFLYSFKKTDTPNPRKHRENSAESQTELMEADWEHGSGRQKGKRMKQISRKGAENQRRRSVFGRYQRRPPAIPSRRKSLHLRCANQQAASRAASGRLNRKRKRKPRSQQKKTSPFYRSRVAPIKFTI